MPEPHAPRRNTRLTHAPTPPPRNFGLRERSYRFAASALRTTAQPRSTPNPGNTAAAPPKQICRDASGIGRPACGFLLHKQNTSKNSHATPSISSVGVLAALVSANAALSNSLRLCALPTDVHSSRRFIAPIAMPASPPSSETRPAVSIHADQNCPECLIPAVMTLSNMNSDIQTAPVRNPSTNAAARAWRRATRRQAAVATSESTANSRTLNQ